MPNCIYQFAKKKQNGCICLQHGLCLIATCILCGLQHDMSVCKNKKWLYLFCNMACLQPVSFVGCNMACQFAKNNGLYLRVAVIATWKSV
jgi:hypothetical protein